MALFASSMLVVFGVALCPPFHLLPIPPAWLLPARCLFALGFSSVLLFGYLFPDGRVVPRWARWPAVTSVVVNAAARFDAPFLHALPPMLLNPLFTAIWLAPVGAQVYRYRRVSGP